MAYYYKKTHKSTAAETRIKKAYREAHPVCEACRSEPPTDAHHIVTEGSGGPTDPENLVALCRVCHTVWHLIGWHKAIDRWPHLAAKVVAARVREGRKLL
jgi:hypothetical protein